MNIERSDLLREVALHMNAKSQIKWISFSVGLCFLLTTIVPTASAAPTAEEELSIVSVQDDKDSCREVEQESYEVLPDYGTYLNENASVPVYDGKPIILDAAHASCADGGARSFEGRSAVIVSKDGYVTWEIPAVEEALYLLQIRYASTLDSGSAYSCEVLINDKKVYRQASLTVLHKKWANPKGISNLPARFFEHDQYGNELVPVLEEVQGWQVQCLTDSDGRYEDGLLFRLGTGDRLTLHIKKSAIAISELSLVAVEKQMPYEQKKLEYQASGYPMLSGEATVIQAELPLYTSDSSLLPTSDHMSVATQPQDAMHILQNTIGKEYWQYAEQTITWQFSVPKTGLYKINIRYRQNYQRGVSVGRVFRIDGAIPFEELKNYQFEFSDSWENEQLGNENEPFLFYLEAGKDHTISMEVVMAYPTQVRKLESTLQELNTFYRQVLMIVGTNPDPYRDYMLDSIIPNFKEELEQYQEDLQVLLNDLYESGFKRGGSIVVVEELADMIASFSEKPGKIPVRLSTFNDSLSALGNWLAELSRQPLEIDYLMFLPGNEEAPREDTALFKSFAYSFQVFLASFYGDYSSIASVDSERALSVWINSGRDQAQVIKRLVSSSFTGKYGIPVNVSLVLQGLIPATLSGKGPDIIIGVNPTDAVNLAARDALVDLRDFQDVDQAASFDTVRSWFQPYSLDLYTYENEIYALPIEEVFNMMFIRTDIFQELGLSAPRTWEELNNTISVLSRNNLDVGLPTNQGQNSVNESIFQTLLFQNGGSYYEDGWSKTGFSSPAAITAFTQWTEYFTQYTLPTDYDLFSRFRSGQMPLALNAYSFYNNLNVGAPEIRGLWEMLPVPGTIKEDKTLDQSTAGSGSAIALFRKTANKDDGWRFLQWYVSNETQAMYARQIESILGPGGRCTPATVGVLHEIGWEEEVEEQIMNQWNQMKVIPMTPVSYYLSRSISNAFRKVTYSYTDPRETLNRYNREINKEIARKRANLGL